MQNFFAWAGGPITSWWGLLARLLLGVVLSLGIGWAGYRRRSLSRSGVWGAVLVGTAIIGFGGWVWGLLLIAFFVTSSALSHYRHDAKREVEANFAKTGRRDIWQTFANGGLGALLALAFALTGSTSALLFAAFAGAMAAVNADTWATELGVLSNERPRLITTGQEVPPGTSGAVSRLGLVAAFTGSLLIGVLALAFTLVQRWLAGTPGPSLKWLPLAAALGGLAGSLFDSLLGATVQTVYYCMGCGKETEKSLHTCGRTPLYVRGWRWLNNDWVNFFCSAAGALVAVGLGAALARLF